MYITRPKEEAPKNQWKAYAEWLENLTAELREELSTLQQELPVEHDPEYPYFVVYGQEQTWPCKDKKAVFDRAATLREQGYKVLGVIMTAHGAPLTRLGDNLYPLALYAEA